MTTGDRYRGFARECLRWAERATDIEHREALLEMATCWVDAAARLDHQHVLNRQFRNIVSEANRHLSNALHASAIDGNNGNGQLKQTDGDGLPKKADGVDLDEDGRQLLRER